MSGVFNLGGKAQKLWEMAINTPMKSAVFSGPAQSTEPPVPGPCLCLIYILMRERWFFSLLPCVLSFQRHILKMRHFLLQFAWCWWCGGEGLAGGSAPQGRMCPPFRGIKPSPSAALALGLFKGSSVIVCFGCNQAWPINTEMARIKLIKPSELFPLMSPFIHHKGNSRMNCQRSFGLLSRFRRIKKLQRSPSAVARTGSGLV